LSFYQQKYSLEDAYSKFQKNSAVDICYPLVYYAAYSGNPIQTFQKNLSVPSSKTKKSPWRWDRQVVPKRRYGTLRCLISQKRADLVYVAAEDWNHIYTRNSAVVTLVAHANGYCKQYTEKM